MQFISSFPKKFGLSFDTSNVVKVGRNYFLADNDLATFKSSINKDVFSVGVFLGEFKGDFIPSPAFIDILSKLDESRNKLIYANHKAEWLFLCGRNLLSESFNNPNNLSSGLVFVQNELNENLGYGLFKKEDKLIVRNLLDKGRYLRHNEKGR